MLAPHRVRAIVERSLCTLQLNSYSSLRSNVLNGNITGYRLPISNGVNIFHSWGKNNFRENCCIQNESIKHFKNNLFAKTVHDTLDTLNRYVWWLTEILWFITKPFIDLRLFTCYPTSSEYLAVRPGRIP